MQDIWQFIVDNWQLVAAACLSLVSFIVALIRKRPHAYDFLDYIRQIISGSLPTWINEAEQKYLDGEQKKLYVLKKCLTALRQKVLGLTGSQEKEALGIFGFAIEQVLSTPRKKI